MSSFLVDVARHDSESFDNALPRTPTIFAVLIGFIHVTSKQSVRSCSSSAASPIDNESPPNTVTDTTNNIFRHHLFLLLWYK